MSKEIREQIEKVKNFKKTLNEAYIDSNGNLIDLKQDLSQEDINEILKGYIECALWTEEERLREDSTVDDAATDDQDDDEEDMDEIEKIISLKNKLNKKEFTSFVSDDINDDSKVDAYIDIKQFIKNAGDDAINEAIKEQGLFRLGMDIWFTRNGHGAGFFDHNYEKETKESLTKAGHQLKPKDLYIGDDGRLYFS